MAVSVDVLPLRLGMVGDGAVRLSDVQVGAGEVCG